MPRAHRALTGGLCYHVLNRGNAGARVYVDEADYRAFTELIGAACDRLPMRVLAYCLMPNHFHFVLWPWRDGDVSQWMQWLMTVHVRRHHKRHDSSGHVWQGRFKAFPIQQDAHLFTVLRYVERNPLRAALVERAEDWSWSSLRWWGSSKRPAFLHDGPFPRGADWLERVNPAQSTAELAALRQSVVRGSPYGGVRWAENVAERLGLESSLRARGRPRKK